MAHVKGNGIELDYFLLDNLFDAVETPEGTCYYASEKHNEGWIVVWPDGEHFHTNRYPPDFLTEGAW